MRSPLVTVIGEALIDLVPGEAPGDYQAHAGGSPFNVAVALARLRESTALMARLSDHGFGQLLRDRAAAEDIDLSAAARATEPATLAVVSLNGTGQASYDFYVEGTADWHWTIGELRRLPSKTEIVHFGARELRPEHPPCRPRFPVTRPDARRAQRAPRPPRQGQSRGSRMALSLAVA